MAALCLLCAGGVGVAMPRLPGNPRIPLRQRLAVLRRPGVIDVLPLKVLGLGAGCVMWASAGIATRRYR